MFHKNNTMRRIPEGSVISQDPEPGTKVEKGTKITVVISKGPEATSTKRSTSGNYYTI